MVRRFETLPLSLLLALCFVAPRVARAQADTDAEAPPTDTIDDASEATEPPPPAAEEDERASADEPAPPCVTSVALSSVTFSI